VVEAEPQIVRFRNRRPKSAARMSRIEMRLKLPSKSPFSSVRLDPVELMNNKKKFC
jgi:hypothetical protein